MHSCFRLVLKPAAISLTLALLTAVSGMAAGAEGARRITSTIHADFRTGKLVRSVMVTSKPVSPQRVAETVLLPRVVSNAVAVQVSRTPEAGIDGAIEQIAAEQQLSPQLIHSVIKVESNYNPFAVSPKGARGLMQLIPSTARRFGVADSFNPLENIQGGAKYLKYLLNLYSGDYPLALAAYNAGEGAVAKYRGVPPYAETQNYLLLVQRQLQFAKKAAAAKHLLQETNAADLAPGVSGHIVSGHIQELTQADGTVRYVAQ